jgi:hypothetical protein
MKRAFVFAIALMTAPPAWAGDAEESYSIRFSVAGFLTRSEAVCGGDLYRTAKAVLKVIRTDEMKAMLRGFPKLTTKWMEGGAHAFNQGVLKDGVGAACGKALEVQTEVEGN